MRLLVFLCVCVLALVKVQSQPTYATVETKCGYASCQPYSRDTLNVHLIPHSHDDVGWLKTVDQYYYGTSTNIQRAGVQYIISSVVEALKLNPERRFIQVETAFFHKWWLLQNNDTQIAVKKLVDNGQLEFIGGGWSMNDEGAVHYHSVIDQFTFGLGILNDTFGECGRPKIGWQIDPFGHSKEMASLFAGMGYDGLFFSRLDWRDKMERLRTETPEILWQSSKSLGDASNLFTSILYNHYSAPEGFCFDVLCTQNPIVDDIESPIYNYREKVKLFADFIKKQAPGYSSNNIHITMGDDFNYQDALSYYHNLDKLIKGFDLFEESYNGQRIKLLYSTPSCYVKSVNEAATARDIKYAIKTDDFLPLGNDENTYWSGYYTSRPTSKRMERQANNLLQIIKQLAALNYDNQTSRPSIFSIENAVGIMQHHDAITGTEKQDVANDYHRIVDKAINNATVEINNLFTKYLGVNYEFDHCILANISVCKQSSESTFTVGVYNPISRPVNVMVKLPVMEGTFEVTDPKNKVVPNQVTVSMDTFSTQGTFTHATHELVFQADLVPALGLKLFYVTKTSTTNPITSTAETTIGDPVTGLTIDPDTGFINSVTINGTKLNLKQELMYYVGARGDNEEAKNRSSGAYIFRPSPDLPTAKSITKVATFKTYKGAIFDEVHQVFSNWAKQVVRIYNQSNHIEFDWLIGPIDTETDKISKEVISRFTTDINSKDLFYTDSNGREMIERKLNFRSTYKYTNEEPVAGNYYPVTSRIAIKDDTRQLNILNDRAQGGTSLNSGELELMVHRRLLNDDAFGVGEPLNELSFGDGLLARGTHYLTLSGGDSPSVDYTKALEQEKGLPAWTFVARANVTKDEFTKAKVKEFSAVTTDLPSNVQILTLQPHPFVNKTLILRLEHIYEKDENSDLAANVSANIEKLFNGTRLTSIRETTLGANQWLENRVGFEWKKGAALEEIVNRRTNDERDYGTSTVKSTTKATYSITLMPKEIRTFILGVDVIKPVSTNGANETHIFGFAFYLIVFNFLRFLNM